MKNAYTIGIDEVGRGALAGPVTVAVALVPQKITFKKLRDSKKLSPAQREKWFQTFKDDQKIKYIVAKVHPRKIEKINISRAANLAALRAYKRLVSSFRYQVSRAQVYLDGGLYLGNGRQRILKFPRQSASSPHLSATTVICGDEKIPAIKIASIIAKVSRDKFMIRLAKKYPTYGFEIHKGYGTRAHYVALKKFGPSEIHRLTFL